MNERLKIYIAFLIVIPFLVTLLVGTFALIPEELKGVIYFLSLISTHLITSKAQEILK
ncbi:hypothetical protein GCM10011351_31950 [Paraliobacillus quinghaiensis]|uniref:Uncharacterized protein n=1 Tax=Paraliobacillus quinghaiensis TaxID=470815 RepID=A0A917TYA1_9BACI|nr:hypothetical protein [Paraliobacillus quinghaiensis]GGM43576.1 hypothetical protein GCM10011351_31950 [Paraliobacillus quinghaiensis]